MSPFGGLLAGLVFVSAASIPSPLPQEHEPEDLAELSLEELLGLEITVASRRKEKLRDAPAAVYVLTGDEIRRSGHTSVQEALRMVPGFHVAQWKSFGWDVTSRGFTGSLSALNESFANQLLLLVDGVSFYSPVIAGIWWPLVDIPIADIDRIEIIRGPAGTLWGANAVNGVVHVITKHARDTTGSQLSSTLGDWEASGDLRHGGRLGESGWYRTWASYSNYDALPASTGEKFPEDWWIASVGYRADWDRGASGRYRFIASAYTSEFGEELWDAVVMAYHPFDDTLKSGGYMLGSWEIGEEGDTHKVQSWYSIDYQKQFDLVHDVHSFDLEYTRTKTPGERHRLSYGLGYRLVDSLLDDENGDRGFEPESRQIHGGRVFVQDQIGLPDLESKLVLGTQVEWNSLADLEVQPNARWLWNPTEDETVWGAVSRAVRTPSIEEVDLDRRLDVNAPPYFRGTDSFESEEVLAYELGYRRPLTDRAFLDLATFYNDFDDLQSVELDGSGTTEFFANKVQAHAYGAELALDADVSSDWRLRSSYTYFRMDFEADSDSAEASTVDTKDGLVPKHRIGLRSYYDLSETWEFDTALYWTDEHSSSFFKNPDYLRVDARLGWNPTEKVQFSIGVQNLTQSEHPEAGEDIFWYGSLVERNVYVNLRLTL